MKGEKVILGIDPGTNVMGYGVIKVVNGKAEMVSMGVIDMRKMSDPYLRLGKIFERVTGIIAEYLPDEWQSKHLFRKERAIDVLNLDARRALPSQQRIQRDIPIHEYAPLKIKMAITGNGQASKEQVVRNVNVVC